MGKHPADLYKDHLKPFLRSKTEEFRDFAQVLGNSSITEEVAVDALERLQVDKLGLDHIDRKLLMGMIEKFGGGPVGIDTISATIGD